MSAYALAHLRLRGMHTDLVEYVRRIQDTLDPYQGRFLVHGGHKDVMEGEWPGDVVLIGFPDAAAAHAWYASPGYQDILPLRTRHLDGDIVIVEGVPADYAPADKAASFRRQISAEHT